MIREIQRLQRRNEDLEEQKDTLDEKNTWIEQIMHSLREDRQASEIVMRLKRGESHKIIAEWLGRPLIGDIDVAQLSPTTETDLNTAITQYHSKLVEDKDPRYWTSATHDAQLIRHLITLYLTWIHPVHMLFDEEHFVASFENCSDVYCAPGLVNIICAMSCHLLHDIDTEDEETTRAIDYLRNRFVAEAKSFIRTAEMKKLTTIQTYAIMFLTELGSGHGLMGTSHLRLAVETLVEKHHAEQSAESEQVAAWGILTLHTFVSRSWNSLPTMLTSSAPGQHSSTPSHKFPSQRMPPPLRRTYFRMVERDFGAYINNLATPTIHRGRRFRS